MIDSISTGYDAFQVYDPEKSLILPIRLRRPRCCRNITTALVPSGLLLPAPISELIWL